MIKRKFIRTIPVYLVATIVLGMLAFVLSQIVVVEADNRLSRAETGQMFAQAPAARGRSSSIAMSDSFLPVSSAKQSTSRIAPTPSMETAAQDRKLRETHRFTFEAQRDDIREHYRRTTEACLIEWCTMLNGSISTQGASHHADIAVRVEPGKMDSFLEAVRNGDGDLELLNHSRTAQDMTAEFQDLAARQKSQKALRDRLIALTRSTLADDVSDLLQIEQELARVQGRIESMDARLRTINTVTERTTIHISFRSEALESPISHPPYIRNALNEVGSIASQNTGNVIKVTAALAPYGIPIALLALIVRLALRRRKKRSTEQMEAN